MRAYPPVPKWLAAAVALAGVAVMAPHAAAQFRPGGVGFNYNFGISPNVQRNPLAPFLPTVPGYYATTGFRMTAYGYNGPVSANYVYYRLNNGTSYSRGYGSMYMQGLTSGYGYGSGEIAARQQDAIAAGQKAAQWDGKTGEFSKDFDRWLKDQGDRRTGPADPKAAPAIDASLINPPDAQVASGVALNTIVTRIGELEAKGKKAAAGQVSPDLMTKVVFDGGPAADAANVFRSADLTYPTPLSGNDYADLRTALDKAFAPVATAASAGKKATPYEIDQLTSATTKARTAAAPVMKDALTNEARSVAAFFDRLTAAAKYLNDPASTGVAGTKWVSVGAGVDELARHMTKHKLKFGPAADGDAAAYSALHRGLLAYYAGLSMAK